MSMSDPVADLLTRIRNATMRKHPYTECPASLLKAEVVRVLKSEGFILDWNAGADAAGKPALTIELKYDEQGGSTISGIKRISRPGLRRYTGYRELTTVLNGQGIAIVSTSSGVLTDRECRERKVGGEVLCHVW